MKYITDKLTNLLLTIIAVLLFLIWQRMPPNVGEIAAAKGAERKALSMKQPVVKAVIPDTIDVNVENLSLDVNVENAPLDVTLVR
jgi:hypothetical protein